VNINNDEEINKRFDYLLLLLNV